jgi:proteasome assembly chaperone (PAC2) family protein
VDTIQVERWPDLRDPIAVIAFAGWNDAASAATNAARFMVRRMAARRFGSIDAEPFFNFAETRPTVRIDSRGERHLSWPANEFFYARNPNGEHDIVVAIGVEPSLRWRTFANAYVDLFSKVGVRFTVALGALLADVPHTRPVRVTGSSMDESLGRRLNLAPSRYEGPTGIVGVLHDALRQRDTPGASLWANVPHYISTAQNPPATIALLQRLEEIIPVEFDLSELHTASDRFVAEVNTAVSVNPEVLSYIQQLEEAMDGGAEPLTSQLPAAHDVVLDVEEFLRSQRGDDD